MKPARKPQRRSKPPLSVVMPVHNALPYLDDAIASILNQTFSDFEFAIFDDGSTDGSTEKLREWALRDSRIRLIETATNLGPVLSSQSAADAAHSPIVARMDADDISNADRLLQQLEVLNDQPDVGLVASLYDLIDSGGRTIRSADVWRLSQRSPMAPFPHSAIMYRKDIFDRAGGYRQGTEYWEDQDLVTRMSRVSKIMVIPRSLLRVRQTATSTRSMASTERQEDAVDAMYRSIPGVPAGPQPRPGDAKLDPRVFVSIGSVELWAGGRPKAFRRMLRRGRLSMDGKSLRALAWAGWASASPGLLRTCLRWAAALRNATARAGMDLSRPVLWSPPAQELAKPPGATASPAARKPTSPSGKPIRKARSTRASA